MKEGWFGAAALAALLFSTAPAFACAGCNEIIYVLELNGHPISDVDLTKEECLEFGAQLAPGVTLVTPKSSLTCTPYPVKRQKT